MVENGLLCARYQGDYKGMLLIARYLFELVVGEVSITDTELCGADARDHSNRGSPDGGTEA
jgi:hypothetical protein